MTAATKPQANRTETRHIPASMEIREEDGKKFLVGKVISYNELSNKIFGFREKIDPGAFTDSLGPDGDDVRALGHHTAEMVIGRQTASTLKLDNRNDGIYFEIEMPDTTYARDLIVSVERGDITGMSFGFRTVEDKWTYDEVEGVEIRTVLSARLREISVVAWPAYPQTVIDTETRAMESTLDDFRAKLAKGTKDDDSTDDSSNSPGMTDEQRKDQDLWRTQIALT